jgi:hypothetical protein
MSAGWKTLDNQNNSFIVNLSEDEHLDDHERDYWTDTLMMPKQVMY